MPELIDDGLDYPVYLGKCNQPNLYVLIGAISARVVGSPALEQGGLFIYFSSVSYA